MKTLIERVAQRFLSPERQWAQDEAKRAKTLTEARRVFRQVLKGLVDEAQEVKALFPGKTEDAVKKRSRAMLTKIAQDPALLQFLDAFIPEHLEKATSWRKSVTSLAREILLGVKPIGAGLEALDARVSAAWQEGEIFSDQKPLREALPPEFLSFLPPNVVVNVDADGTIQRVTDRFSQQYKTMGEKIRRMKLIVAQYNKIVKQVKKDMASKDEVIRMAATITALMMETGIRPGQQGNRIIETTDEGEKLEVETFGAITLGLEHVNIVREDFAKLEFMGKAGTINTAKLSDSQIIAVLRAFMDRASTAGHKYIFTTKDGEPFGKRDLDRYFRQNFSEIAPTDFRKLRATEAVLQGLRDRQDALHAEILKFVDESADDLKVRIVDAVARVVREAVEDARSALSHDSGADVTQQSYINPEVLLRFLSEGRIEDNLKDAILKGKTQLRFDPMKFAAVATGKTASGMSLQDILDGLESREI